VSHIVPCCFGKVNSFVSTGTLPEFKDWIFRPNLYTRIEIYKSDLPVLTLNMFRDEWESYNSRAFTHQCTKVMV